MAGCTREAQGAPFPFALWAFLVCGDDGYSRDDVLTCGVPLADDTVRWETEMTKEDFIGPDEPPEIPGRKMDEIDVMDLRRARARGELTVDAVRDFAKSHDMVIISVLAAVYGRTWRGVPAAIPDPHADLHDFPSWAKRMCTRLWAEGKV